MVFWAATAVCLIRFCRVPKTRPVAVDEGAGAPSVSIIKPICGVEKNLYANSISACLQDYGKYETIFAFNDSSDPALPIIARVVDDCRRSGIRIIVDEHQSGSNGKVNNLYNGLARAHGQIIVVSDSDMCLTADYLQRLTAPLADSGTGVVCTLYLARAPGNFFEILELLTYNTDFVPAMVLAYMTGTAVVCPGASMAVRREVLGSIGGMRSLSDCFVEDYELARRAAANGYRLRLIPHAVHMTLEVHTCADWWQHQVGWDQKTRSATAWGYCFTLLLRGIPLSFLYAALDGPHAWAIVSLTVAVRISSGLINAWLLRDPDGRRHIWLLPVRDILSIFVWSAALFKRKITWRGKSFSLIKGKLEALR